MLPEESQVRAVLLNSGGIDSRVAAAIASKGGWSLTSLYIDNNPHNHDRAIRAAQRTADLYCTEHVVMPFPMDLTLLGDKRPSDKLPGAIGYSSIVTIVLGAAFARHRQIDNVISGTKNDVWSGDGWKTHLQDLFSCFSLYSKGHTYFHTPVEEYKTVQMIVEKAKKLGVPLEDTVSCGHPTPCGICNKCTQRVKLGLPLC